MRTNDTKSVSFEWCSNKQMKKELLADILKDMRVELADEFDQNFVRGGFFGSEWKAKLNGESSKLQQSAKLRRSIRATERGSAVVFTSSEPYATINNEGGEIVVTAKMRKYFWAQYYKHGKHSEKARMYRNLALKAVGSKLQIPQRQYIGDHAQVRTNIETIVKDNVERYTVQAFEKLNRKK